MAFQPSVSKLDYAPPLGRINAMCGKDTHGREVRGKLGVGSLTPGNPPPSLFRKAERELLGEDVAEPGQEACDTVELILIRKPR